MQIGRRSYERDNYISVHSAGIRVWDLLLYRSTGIQDMKGIKFVNHAMNLFQVLILLITFI